MGSGTFRGGIHPYDGKDLSRDRQSRISVREKNWPILYPSISEHLQNLL